MLAVVTELCCLDLKAWHGCVKFNLGSTLYMDLTAAEDSAAFGRQVQTLGDKLLQMLAASYGVSAVAAQASPAPAVAGAVSSGGTGFFNRIGISDQVLSLACYLYMYVCVCVYIYICSIHFACIIMRMCHITRIDPDIHTR